MTPPRTSDRMAAHCRALFPAGTPLVELHNVPEGARFRHRPDGGLVLKQGNFDAALPQLVEVVG